MIETEKEFTSDVLLVQLVKLRLISERVTEAPWLTQLDHLGGPPAMFYLKSLEAQLRDFKSNIPSESLDNSASSSPLLFTETTMYCCMFLLFVCLID